MLMRPYTEGVARTAVQIATSSAFVDEGQPVEAHPYWISKEGMNHPDLIMAASFAVRPDQFDYMFNITSWPKFRGGGGGK